MEDLLKYTAQKPTAMHNSAVCLIGFPMPGLCDDMLWHSRSPAKVFVKLSLSVHDSDVSSLRDMQRQSSNLGHNTHVYVSLHQVVAALCGKALLKG